MRNNGRKGKKQAEFKPPLHDFVTGHVRQPFFRAVTCPCCGTQVKYTRLLGRAPRFKERCTHCGNEFTCGPGVRSAVFGLLFLLFACLFVLAVMAIATDLVPVFVFTILPVLGAYFIWPFTLKVCKKKQK